ncbi:hypothetical protein MTR67_022452 [Solanum verrucosum]|uniref:DNA topoisomerase n=1 Tax=Solanum verrucosum TaxID=315347 RepID=A0AAF0QRV9_SOLVR|nr:hypothetical protein MTR67_022452 [Solanum verrucosum]
MAGGGGRVIRVLNVAEKPSVAKAVSGILSKNQPGGMRVRDGRSRYNKIFEFNYTIRNQPCQMLFTSVTGHLMELEFDERYRKWHSCDPLDLYNAPVRKFVPEVPLYPIYLKFISCRIFVSWIKVGNGRDTRFWLDEWIGLTPPMSSFQNLYAFTLNTGSWFHIAGLEVTGTKEDPDRLWWKMDSRGCFKVSLAYKLLNRDLQLMDNWPWKNIWKVKTPYRVACFKWLLAWEEDHKSYGRSSLASEVLFGQCQERLLRPCCAGKKQDKLDIKRTLEAEARSCQWIVLWLDCDREGENIAFEVLDVCRQANHNLNVWRARFSALIDREIHQSVQTLVQPNQLFSDAVDVRQEIDLRIGASFTRFQTMLLRGAFVLDFATDDRNIVLSYGPCQFPTLGFVVERYWEIQAHEPEEFWTINCTHNSDEGTATFNWMRGHLFDYTCGVTIYEMCIQEPIATVTKVKQQEKLKYPPHPLSTIELEKRASRYFRMSSEQTMKVAEDLYQNGFISYPRTETDSFSEKTDLRTMVQEQEGHPVWGIYAQRLLDPQSGLWRNPSGGGHDDKAHPPIHPTKFSAGETRWSQDHHRVYELVVRHFLACVSQPAVGAETIVEIDIAGESFSACGRVILAVESLAGVLGGRVGELPTIYLGMPLGGKSKSIGIWNGVIEKCEKKLTNWKSQYLSRGGENMLWREVIKAKYEMENRWMTKMVTTPYGCGIWRSIRNLWPLFLSRIRFQVGQGWNLHLRRNLNDWEMGNIVAFHDTMAQFSNLTREEERGPPQVDQECQADTGTESWTTIGPFTCLHVCFELGCLRKLCRRVRLTNPEKNWSTNVPPHASESASYLSASQHVFPPATGFWKNYLDVYRFESWGGSVIPTYSFGQQVDLIHDSLKKYEFSCTFLSFVTSGSVQFTPTTLTLDSGVTRPPPLLSEADLLGCMDKAGIGTDATMHDHIKKLLDRFYAIKDSNTRFSPTKLDISGFSFVLCHIRTSSGPRILVKQNQLGNGEALVMGYDDMGYELWKPYLRAMMECDMKAVSIGTKRKAEVLETCLQQMQACFSDARTNKGKLLEAMAIFFERSNRSSGGEQQAVGDVVRRCGLCLESDMVLRQKPDGNFMVGCLGYPQVGAFPVILFNSYHRNLAQLFLGSL